MTQEITEEMVRAQSDGNLARIEEWLHSEKKVRAETHKQQTLAKIRELARSIEVVVKIEGVRGRPAKTKS